MMCVELAGKTDRGFPLGFQRKSKPEWQKKPATTSGTKIRLSDYWETTAAEGVHLGKKQGMKEKSGSRD